MTKKEDIELIQELRERLDYFEEAVRERDSLKQQLQEVNKKLNESEEFKSHFIARISNEIINPFTAIMTIADNLMNSSGKAPDDVAKLIGYVYDEALFLDFQLKNLFMAARIEAGDLDVEHGHVLPEEVISEAMESFNKEMFRKKLKWDKNVNVKNSVRFKTDAEKLRLIFKNLISNAVKYAYHETTITVRAECSEEFLTFEVENEGEQIAARDKEVVFDRFRQLDDRIHSLNPGSGIGLSICRELTELLGGSIHVDTKPNGMCFRVEIPPAAGTGFETEDDDLFLEEDTEQGETL